MHAAAVRFDLHVPASRSLKAKRAAIRPVVDGLRHRFKVSVAEVDYQDQWQRASIGVALVDGSAAHLEEVFTLDEWGYAALENDGVVPEGAEDRAQRAIADCPVHAISVAE